MARKSIVVDDDNGIYDYRFGAQPRPFRASDHETIRVIESLMGWGPYRWAISVSRFGGATHFVTGAAEPKEKGI